MMIRMETEQDRRQVLKLVENAFLTAVHSDGSEHHLVERLYHSEAFIPQLALVAEIEHEIVGYILFTEVHIGGGKALALAPLAVDPKRQKQGIGSALIEQGHQIAKTLGYGYSVVLGEPSYYARFGYQPAEKWQITAPFDVPSDYFMAIELDSKTDKLCGEVQYTKEFEL